ncbi:hypothetical protein EGI32_10045 [Ferruginibacter sp. HRS2-29]|nr:hypothetical protein [Ferruginibacter sp. HRS2-29]
MREWLHEVVQKGEAPVYNFLWLHDELTRLAEAAWLLGEQNRVSIASKKQKIKLASNELKEPAIKKKK